MQLSPARRAQIRQIIDQRDPEPIIAVLETFATEARQQRLQEVFASRLNAVTVLMDAPHDPHNGAAVMRSCDAFGVGRLHVVERNKRFVASGTVAKGTERWVDVDAYKTVSDAVEKLSASGHVLVGTHPEGELRPADLANLERVALVMGNEHDGICEALSAACKHAVSVPMRGFVESLNVSVTAAILLSQACAERPGDLSAIEQRRLYARGLIQTVPRALDVLEANGVHDCTSIAVCADDEARYAPTNGSRWK